MRLKHRLRERLDYYMQGLLIRLDDISPDMDWTKFNRLRDIFEQNHIYPLLGIVPDNQDQKLHKMEAREEFWDIMLSLQQQGYVLAQHGYQHIYGNHESGILGINKNSEFAGFSYQEQLDKLEKGKKILESHNIYADIFMAPSHSYDKDTLKALKAAGFHYITDGYGCSPYNWKGIGFIPCTLSKYQKRNGIDTICLHANTMTEQMIAQLEKDIVQHREEFLAWNSVLSDIPKRTIVIALKEQKELVLRRIKAFMGSSQAIQEYLQKSNDQNKGKKLVKRMIGFPIAFLKALIVKN